ncbi:MAG TPA: hypothetical protein GYA06_12800 [Chloroflexi bacterium]|nr:hypothetical protein [Chloroflexota bacterium]
MIPYNTRKTDTGGKKKQIPDLVAKYLANRAKARAAAQSQQAQQAQQNRQAWTRYGPAYGWPYQSSGLANTFGAQQAQRTQSPPLSRANQAWADRYGYRGPNVRPPAQPNRSYALRYSTVLPGGGGGYTLYNGIRDYGTLQQRTQNGQTLLNQPRGMSDRALRAWSDRLSGEAAWYFSQDAPPGPEWGNGSAGYGDWGWYGRGGYGGGGGGYSYEERPPEWWLNMVQWRI